MPGAPVPAADDDGIWIAPQVRVANDAFTDSIPEGGAPIVLQGASPTQRPIPSTRAALSRAASATRGTSRSLAEIGAARFALYDDYGLDSSETVGSQLRALGDSHLSEIAEELLDISEETAAAVLQGGIDPALWCEGHEVASVVGQTLFWAKHYFVPDPVGARLLEGRLDPGGLETPLKSHIEQRHLIERGLVVPFPTEMAVPWIAGRVEAATAEDLADGDLVRWVTSQLVIEGPTAREVLLVSALDDHQSSSPFLFGRLHGGIEKEGRFASRMLREYDPEFDYGPWEETVRKQFIARAVQETNTALGVAELVRGRWLAPSPFRARLVRLLGVPTRGPDFLADVNVPWLPEVDMATLMSMARNEVAVDDLRSAVARCIAAVDSGARDVSDLQALVDEHAGEAAGVLDRALKSDRVLKRFVPGAAVAGSLLLSATLGPIGLAGSALTALGAGAPLMSDYLRDRRTAAFLFWTARQRVEASARH